MNTIYQVSDYVIFRCKTEGDTDLSVLKLHKLLYYIQAWFLAFYGKKAFNEKFQAWIHGPVSKEIFNLYKEKYHIYSEINKKDIQDFNNINKINNNLKNHIDTILDYYARYTATQLELMTHEEKPWIEARNGYEPIQRCEVEINEDTMKEYYAERLKDDKKK